MKTSFKWIIGIVLIAVAIIGYNNVVNKIGNNKLPEKSEAESLFTFAEDSFDFGTIKQSGGIVKHNFVFTYNGNDPITITSTPGSCLCTIGKISKTEFKKGDKGTLTVEFDPNLHEEPEGKFFKSVSILTEPKLEEIPEVKIWTEIDLDLGPEAFKLKIHDDDDDHDNYDGHHDEVIDYNGKKIYLIEPEDLKEKLANKDFFLLDVHIPEQTHIPGTDAVIDYRKLKENADKLPEDKDTKIVVYCRSGSMSRSSARDLVDMGYTNVHDLEGGINAFNAL